MWQHVVVCVRCTQEIQISILSRKISLKMSFSKLPELLGSATLIHDPFICYFGVFNLVN